MLRRLAMAVAILSLSIASCGSPKAVTPPVRGSTPAPGDTRLFYKAHLTMSVSGAESFVLDTDTLIDVHEIAGERNPVAIWFLTVSAGERMTTPEGRILSFSADLAPGTYRGPGKYTIDGKTQGKVLGVETNIGSAAFLTVADLRSKPPRAARYGLLTKPCELVFEKDAIRGSVTCPALGSDDGSGKQINLTWRWERL